MTVDELYDEMESLYDHYDREYGIYMSMELDMLYVNQCIHNMTAIDNIPIDETYNIVKDMIMGAADSASFHQSRGYIQEDY